MEIQEDEMAGVRVCVLRAKWNVEMLRSIIAVAV